MNIDHNSTRRVFEMLSRGQFLSANTIRPEFRKLYDEVEEYFSAFESVYAPLGFHLKKGNNYFYFSREGGRQTIEEKIERFYKYIDRLAFFATFAPGFGEGMRFYVKDIVHKCNVETDLNDQLQRLTSDKSISTHDKVRDLMDEMKRQGFMDCEDDENEGYIVLSSYNYLKDIVDLIDIDPTNE
ncbi:hypothetical protein [Flammeovirga sp. EKP202]|uniref:condensin complex protein MksE n=1 Tax=Flammeovirga sp. EKP202 TaxID=2770592 RepID=UPI00165FA8BF|nr:hypothetical protein [Flammeovirga sp. EKP202]MBD0402410.1 hypothetical protein [Flammeovirga sp. EKP202]